VIRHQTHTCLPQAGTSDLRLRGEISRDYKKTIWRSKVGNGTTVPIYWIWPFRHVNSACWILPVLFASLILENVYITTTMNNGFALNSPSEELKSPVQENDQIIINIVLAWSWREGIMIRNVKQNLSLTALLFFMCCLLCDVQPTDFGWGNRFYSGRPLPIAKYALVFAVNMTGSIYDIRDENEKDGEWYWFQSYLLGPWDMLDLLPGQYIAGSYI